MPSKVINGMMYNGNGIMRRPENHLTDDLFASVGLYSKEDIERAKYNAFSRFGRVLDPYGRLNDTREYLFFVKPDLHIVEPNYSNMELNPELANNYYMRDLVNKYPNVVRQLQHSAPKSDQTPFANLLSFGVNSNLDLPSYEATTMDTPVNMFGVGYEYLDSGETSDYNPTFSLEFVDTKELEIYHFFKAYAEYHKIRKSGIVTPPSRNKYTFKKRLHNTMGVYKFLVDEDMETLIYWAYIWGVFPTSVPREAFNDAAFPDGLTFSINFKGVWVDDMDPGILAEFNRKMSPVIAGRKICPIMRSETLSEGSSIGINGSLPVGAKIIETTTEAGRFGRSKYKLKWYI